MTAAKRILTGRAEYKTIEILSNPDKMYEAITNEKVFKSPAVKSLVRALGRIYYREDVAEEEPTTEVTPEDTIRFGPDFQRPQGMYLGGRVKLKYGYGE